MTIRVRPANEEDAVVLAAIDAATWSPSVTPAPPPDEGHAFFEFGRVPADILVASSDGDVVGYVLLGRDVPLPCAEHVIDLKGLAVSPDHQRRGIGQTLMKAALEEATRRGASRVKSRVLSTNQGSLDLHRACGFGVEGTLSGEFLLDGVFVDDVLLARSVDA